MIIINRQTARRIVNKAEIKHLVFGDYIELVTKLNKYIGTSAMFAIDFVANDEEAELIYEILKEE